MSPTNEQVSENLIRAADLIAAGNWTQRAWARDRLGRAVRRTKTSACSFCAVSAVHVTDGYNENKPSSAGRAIKEVEKDLFGSLRKRNNDCLMVWNDRSERTARDVENAFRETARRLHPDIDKSLLETRS